MSTFQVEWYPPGGTTVGGVASQTQMVSAVDWARDEEFVFFYSDATKPNGSRVFALPLALFPVITRQ